MMKEGTVFKSVTDECKHYINQLMADGGEHTRNEILEYVKRNADSADSVTDGLFTGAIKNMILSSKIETVGRGVYRLKGEGENMTLNEKIVGILGNCKERLNTVCCINLLDVSEQELKTARQVKEFISLIDKEIKKYDDTVEKTGDIEKTEDLKSEVETVLRL